MLKKILILEALLSIFLISCTNSDSDGFMPSGQEVCINFTAKPQSDYSINVGTRGATEINVGIFGVAATDSDSLLDILTGVTENSFCHNLYNAEFTGSLPGGLISAEGLKHVFPLEENSAIAAYAYSPYCDVEPLIGDTSCYIAIDAAANQFRTDYLYTGKVFKSKMEYREDETFALPFMHAFANIEMTFQSTGFIDLEIDTLMLMTNHNGKGLLDIKTGTMIPDDEGYADTLPHKTNLLEEPIILDYNTPLSKMEIYFPPSIHLDSIRLVGSKNRISFDKTFAIPHQPDSAQYAKGKKYSMTFEAATKYFQSE